MSSLFQLNRISAAIDTATLQAEAQAKAGFKRTTEEMYNALGATLPEEENVFLSLAAGAPDLVKSLQPVSLDEDLYKAYNTFFYNSRRAFLIELFDQVADVSNSINCFFAFMRELMQQGRNLFATEANHTEWDRRIQELASRSLKMRDTLRAGDKSSVGTSMYSLLGAMMNGDKHSIRSSSVYSGGIDVVLARSARDNALMCSNIQYGSFLESESTQFGYENNRMQSYMTETSIKVKEAAKGILAFLFGEGNEHSAFEPNLKTLPLTTDFTEIQRIFEKVVGIKLQGQFFHNITFGADGKSKAEQFTRVCLVLHPEKRAAESLSREFTRDIARTDVGPAGLLSAETTIKHRIQQNVTTEAALLNRIVGSTIAFTFDKPTARFIAQAEKGEDLNFSNFDNWFSLWSSQFLRKKGAVVKNSISGGRVKLANIPRYVLPVSKLNKITEARSRLGMSVEATRANEDGLYITPSGTLSYLPTAEDRKQLDTINEYERLAAAVAKTCSDYGINMSLLSEPYEKLVQYGIPHQVYTDTYANLTKLVEYNNSILSYDWDYGLRVYASERPGIVRCEVQIGAVKPDTLVIADYLGYNMAKEGEAPLQKTFADSLMLMTSDNPVGSDKHPRDIYGSTMEPDKFVTSQHFKSVLETYFFHVYKGELPGLSELVTRAMSELNITEFNRETPRDQWSTYGGLITSEGKIRSAGMNAQKDIELVGNLLSRTATSVSGKNGSFIARQVVEDMGDSADYQAIQDAIAKHEDYFVADKSPAHHFARLFNFIGGNVFKQILDGINTLSVQQLTNGERVHEVVETIKQDWTGNENAAPIEMKRKVTRPDSSVLLNFVKPISIIFGKYAQNYEAFEQEAEEAIKSIERDDSIDVEDIHFAGSKDSFSVFPHQLDAHRYLRKPKPPKFAVLDIAPGGGKTSIGLGDMASIVKDMQGLGKKVKPLVLCPDSLVRNWCDDMKTFAGDNWNMIPIDNNVFKRWGAARLQQVIETAPPNTIVVAGLNFLRNNKMSIVIGNAVMNVGTNLEFIKALKFNYIIIDESHKLKGMRTAKHQITKQLTTASFVEYLRIATGTLIADRVKDIEGQVALFSPHIFRQGELSTSTVSQALDDQLKLGDETVQLWKVNTPQRARQRLALFCPVITKKKKEWAFMLPNPIETFYAINFMPEEGTEDELRLGELHRQLYDTVVDESVAALQELLKKAKKIGSDDDDDDDDDDPAEGEEETPDMELNENDELSVLSTQDIDAYLQRIERLIIAPEKDPLFETVFGAYGVKKYVSRKAKKIAQIVDEHFNPPKWDKGALHHEYDLVSHEGDLYLARKQDLDSPGRKQLPRETLGKDPAQNPDIWKKEPEGKVIIFCRYTDSVGAVYGSLSPKYQKMAVRFTGEEIDKWSNLDAFKSDSKIKILIANEMGLSEGHNLQMASRMIRVESPWGPGELDQSASRVFRPDPKGAKEGEIYREAVFLDWVLADNTMEVAKQGRLIAKAFNKARFDEAENPRYSDVLGKYLLTEVSMSLATLQERPSLYDYSEYVEAYTALNGLQRVEFHEMRTTQPANMLPVPQTDVVVGSAKIQTPFVSSQDIPDPNGWKPVTLKQYLRIEDGKPYREDPNRLVGQPVLTDLGNGMIVGVRIRTKLVPGSDGKSTKVTDTDRPISSVMVKLKNGNVIETFSDIGLIYLPTTISHKEIKAEFAVDLAYRKADIKKQEQLLRDQELLEEQEEQERLRQSRREQRQAKVRVKTVSAGERRKKNITEGKAVNTGVTYEPNMKIPTSVKPESEDEVATPLVLSPAYYHGYLTLETDNLEYAKALKKFKFKQIGEYAFVVVQRRNQANAVMDYIEENFHLSDATAKRLGEVFNAFEKGKRGLYTLDLLPSNTLPHFFTVSRTMVKDRKEARFFPFLMDDKLMIAVDVATSPIIKKHIGKAIPNASTKWQLSPGALVAFAENKAALNAKVKELKDAGFVIASPDVLKKEISQINFRASKKK